MKKGRILLINLVIHFTKVGANLLTVGAACQPPKG